MCRFVARLLELLVDATQNDLRIAHDRNLRNTVLANFGRIHIDMDNLRIRRKIGKLAGNAIREARADRDEQIGIGYRIVRELGTVHAHKTQAERIGCRECTFAHQRGNHGDLQLFCHREQFLFGMGRNDAAADVENGALRFLHHLACLADLANIALNRRLVRGNKHILRVLEHHLRTSEVGRNINKNRARTTGVGNIERLAESLGHIVATLEQWL